MNGQAYPVGLVAEQHYQDAVQDLTEGDPANVWHEQGNPYDDLALAVTDSSGRTIGYVPKDCFLRDALHGQGRGCTATILSLEADRRGNGYTHVLLEVELCDGPIEQRGYRTA